MGSGPEHFVANGLAEVLQADGHEVWLELVESKTEFRAEIRTQFELSELLAETPERSDELAVGTQLGGLMCDCGVSVEGFTETAPAVHGYHR